MYTCEPNVDINTISIIRISPYSKTYFLKKGSDCFTRVKDSKKYMMLNNY